MTPCSEKSTGWMASTRGARAAGFTLIELLVTLVLASIVILIFYAFVTVASNATWTQSDALRASERLELAMSTVSTDIRTAGHLGVPNYGLNPDDYRGELVICGSRLSVGGATLDPIAVEVTDSDLEARAFETDPVDLQLLGAFEVQEQLYVTGVSADALQVRAPANFLPDPALLGGSSGWEDAARARWARAIEGSALLIVNSRGGAVLLRAGDPASQPGALLFDPVSGLATVPVPVGELAQVNAAAQTGSGTSERATTEVCRFSEALLTGEGLSVSVLNRVRYRRITAREAGLVAATGETIADPDEPVLIREVIRAGALPVPDAADILDQVLVARNITDFQVFVDGATNSDIGLNGFVEPARLPASALSPHAPGQVGSDTGAATRTLLQRAAGGSCAHHARHVYVQMSAAFDRAVPGLMPQSQLLRSAVPARWADATPNTFTRVLTTRAEVTLPNFSYADLRDSGGC